MAHEAAANTDERVVRHPRDPAAGVAPGRRAPAPETRRLYKADWGTLVTWCHNAGLAALPAEPPTVAEFLAAAVPKLSAGALARRAAAIGDGHRQSGLASPTADPAVKAVLRTARCAAMPRLKLPPSAAQLARMAAACPRDLAGLRDRALLVLAAVGLDRAALVGLDFEHLRFTKSAVELIILDADRVGAPRHLAIPRRSDLTQ